MVEHFCNLHENISVFTSLNQQFELPEYKNLYEGTTQY